MKRIILEATFLILLSTLLGIGSAGLRRPPVPMRLPDQFFVPESGARLILLQDGIDMMEKGGFLFVDVRPVDLFIRGHIPGALSIPAENYTELAVGAADWLHGVPLVLYGSSANVNEADNLAGILMEEGFGPVSILVEGYEAWVEAGLSVGTGRDGILDPDPWGDDDDAWDDDAWDDNDDSWDEGNGPEHDDGSRHEEGAVLFRTWDNSCGDQQFTWCFAGTAEPFSATLPVGKATT